MSVSDLIMAASAGGVSAGTKNFAVVVYAGSTGLVTVDGDVNCAAGSLILFKRRNATALETVAMDTVRGKGTVGHQGTLSLSGVTGAQDSTSITFTARGFTLADNSDPLLNQTGGNFVAWMLRKLSGVLDIITYTGNGSFINHSHNLGVVPALIAVKSTSETSNWAVRYKDQTSGNTLNFGSAAQATRSSQFTTTAPTSSAFAVGASSDTNNTDQTYVAYVFAHNPSGDCQGLSFTTDGSGNGSVDTGWSTVNGIMLKCLTADGDWELYDTARTAAFAGSDARIIVGGALAEDSVSRVSFSGTTLSFTGLSASQTYILIALR